MIAYGRIYKMKKIEKNYLICYYAIVLVLIIIFPPWTMKNLYGDIAFYGFKYIFSEHLYPASNIHGTFLFLEILVATLIFVAILYINKEDK